MNEEITIRVNRHVRIVMIIKIKIKEENFLLSWQFLQNISHYDYTYRLLTVFTTFGTLAIRSDSVDLIKSRRRAGNFRSQLSKWDRRDRVIHPPCKAPLIVSALYTARMSRGSNRLVYA